MAGSPYDPYGYGLAGNWDPYSDPVVKPAGYGTPYKVARSGRLITMVNGRGRYVNGRYSDMVNRNHAPMRPKYEGFGIQSRGFTKHGSVTVKETPKGEKVTHGPGAMVAAPKPKPVKSHVVAKQVARPVAKGTPPRNIQAAPGPMIKSPDMANDPANQFNINSILGQLGLGGGQLDKLLASMSGAPISIADKNGNLTEIGKLLQQATSPLDAGLADKIAAAQYDPVIQGIELQQQVQGRQSAQNMADVANWYQQVVDAANAAASGDAKMGAGLPDSIKNIAASLASSIGGSANPASAEVASTGANDAAFAQAINASQSQYDNLVPALLKSDQAATSQRVQAMDQNAALQLALQLSQAQGAKAGEAAQLAFQIGQQNQALAGQHLQELLGIKQYNSGLKSEAAKNALNTKLALAQMAEAAPSLGLKSALTQAQIAKTLGETPGQLAQTKLSASKLAAQERLWNSEILKNLNSVNPKNPNNAAMSHALSVDLTKALGQAGLLAGATQIKDSKGNFTGDLQLAKGHADPRRLAQIIGNVLRGRKVTGPTARRMAYELYQHFINPDGHRVKPMPGWWANL